jgi:hypothetical protein
MKFRQRFFLVVAVLLLVGISAFAQTTTGSLTGTVTTGGAPLPGATITVSSPALQGTRSAVSDINGNYNMLALPPGNYTVKIELAGMQTVTRTSRVSLGGTSRVDGDLKLSSVTEAITVTASAPAVLETTDVQSNVQQKLVNDLPLGRTVTAIALLAPGTTSNGPRAAITISGATSNDNLIMVDGAVIQENLRGQAHDLFIEDAIQETTVTTGAISAEYGRFTGGVINSISKSGGNQFSGSFRSTFNSPGYGATNPFPGSLKPIDKLSEVYEATLGGRIIRDRLWFFLAGRKTPASVIEAPFKLQGQGAETFPVTDKAHRYEYKVTGQITPRHSLVVTYLDSPLVEANNCQLGCYDQATLDPLITQQNDFRTAHYNGIITSNLIAEVGYSKKRFTFIGFGGDNTDLVLGTPIYSNFGSGAGTMNAPYFCGICSNESRDDKDWNLKATYFLATRSLGTHSIAVGYDDWAEQRVSNNYQSPTNFVVGLYNEPPTRDANGNLLVNVIGGPDGTGDNIQYYPVLFPSLGSDQKVKSIFVNDKWDFNSHFSFNLGVRSDKNDAVDSAHNKTANDQAISPRLGAIYDVFGNSRLRLNASYSQYVGRLAETIAGAGSSNGSPAAFYYSYNGPDLRNVSPHDAVAAVLAWFNAPAQGGLAGQTPYNTIIGGFDTKLKGTIKSPHVNEFTVGAGTQIGTNGFIRADYINRNYADFYVLTTNQQTGSVTEPKTGVQSDLKIVTNDNTFLSRKYNALQAQAQYRLFQRLNLGANYTYSTLKGNSIGENVGSGPITTGGYFFQYPEFNGFKQNNPVGFLPDDQTHKVRAWASMDQPTLIGNFNISVLERFDSGTPYSAIGTINTSSYIPANDPVRSAYISPPGTSTYFFGQRGRFRWDNVTATDLALNYNTPSIHGLDFYVNAELFNALNEKAQVGGNATVRTATSSACKQGPNQDGARCATFNPFTDTPVQGVNYQLAKSTTFGATFGDPTSATSYQIPRLYRFSVGLRF